MMMLEHAGKRLLASAGVPTPQGVVIEASAARDEALSAITSFPVAVKAQVHSGSRGKQGGVRQAKSARELASAVKAIFETDFAGEKPEVILIEPWLAIEREAYLSVAVDGRAEGFVVMYAPQGGIDIED
ncbi:MAG TPA: ATP-grasp domain-containing protein, partial [Burkholderiales bacterium]|nr:ATP-grasp domain-containing protein [Burkholderiales bacterium]